METFRLLEEADAQLSRAQRLSAQLRHIQALHPFPDRHRDTARARSSRHEQQRIETNAHALIDEFGRRARHEAITRGVAALHQEDTQAKAHWQSVFNAILAIQMPPMEAAKKRAKSNGGRRCY